MSQIENVLADLPGLYLTGNAYYGVGLNDCVKQSYRVIKDVTHTLAG
jgi:oxygen-dependent protoporphyrinogen oxidase